MARDLKLDLETIRNRLEGWFAGKLPQAEAVRLSSLEMPGMGASNETFLCDVQWKEGAQTALEKIVVRWSPMRFPLYPRYDMAEQFRLLQRLQGTAVPVPRVRWLEEDASVIGQPFFVMDQIEGWVPRDTPSYHAEGPLREGSTEYRARVWWNAVDTLAAIHTVDWRERGLAFLGEPGDGADPILRHITYYQEMIEMTERQAPAFILDCMAWLEENAVVPDHVSLCWGDSRLGNLILGEDEVRAVLDWELARLGDPETDLGWFLLMDWAVSEGHLVAPAARLAGLPSTEDTVAHYERATGRKVKHSFYHDVFATWRFAVIMHRGDTILKATGYHHSDVDVYGNLARRLERFLGG
jgi:aminoglycoside phosphotransferase (APT) family kinase protein